MTPISGERPPKLIIAIDPGGTTGIAHWMPAAHDKLDGFWDREEIPGCDDDQALAFLFSRLRLIISRTEPFTTIPRIHFLYESFDFRMSERHRDKIDYTAAEVIGAIRHWGLGCSHIKFIRAGAGLGKGFWSDDKIKQAGLWVPGKRHAMDATRHLLRYRAFILNDHSLFEPFRPIAESE